MNYKTTSALTLLLLFLTMLVLPMQVQAEKLAYVDARRLLDEAPQGQDEVKVLEEIFSERNRELKGKIESFKAQEAELEKNTVLLSAEELQAKTDVLRGFQRTLQSEQENYNDDYTRSRDQGLARLEKLIFAVIIELAEQEKIDLVVQQAVYASPGINFTDTVLEELAKRHAAGGDKDGSDKAE